MITAPRARILVIDDDRAVADSLTMVLKFGGYQVDVVYTGAQGLELARKAAYDQLITDVMMTPINGIQVAIAMRDICPDCKILLISGNEQTSKLLADAVREGNDFEILAKPVHPSVILSRLAELHQSSAPSGLPE